jgi:membrane-bound inhibitor of C-type lysozyme
VGDTIVVQTVAGAVGKRFETVLRLKIWWSKGGRKEPRQKLRKEGAFSTMDRVLI